METSECAGMSPIERSVWAQLITTIGIYALYFVGVAASWIGGGFRLFIAACVAHAVVMIAFHTLLARGVSRGGASAGQDERDLAIDRRSSRIAYLTLVGSIFVLVTGVLLGESFWGQTRAQSHVGRLLASPFGVANAALFCLVASEVLRFATQGIMYRRGV